MSAREKFLKSRPQVGQLQTIQIAGEEVEVAFVAPKERRLIELTTLQEADSARQAKEGIDKDEVPAALAYAARLIIECTYEPARGEDGQPLKIDGGVRVDSRVFEPSDMATLADQEIGGWAKDLRDALIEYVSGLNKKEKPAGEPKPG